MSKLVSVNISATQPIHAYPTCPAHSSMPNPFCGDTLHPKPSHFEAESRAHILLSESDPDNALLVNRGDGYCHTHHRFVT